MSKFTCLNEDKKYLHERTKIKTNHPKKKIPSD